MRKTIALFIFICLVTTAYAMPPRIPPFGGKAIGGQQPISGSHVYLYEPGTTTTGISKSILKSATGTTYDGTNYYTTTATDGSFSITSAMYICDTNMPVYAYAVQGNPGAGSNTAIGLMEYLGVCSVTGAISSSTSLIVNEVSTVAMAYAVGGFAADPTHILYSGSSQGLLGIKNAFAMAGNLVNTTSTGGPTSVVGNATVPTSTRNTLADIIASCVNTTGPTSSACSTLFGAATSTGTSTGTIPSDTATAAINMAHHPAANVSTLFYLVTPTAPFQPALSSTPNDLTVQLTFTGTSIGEPWAIAIDAAGNAWVASLVPGSLASGNTVQGGAITKISPSDQILSPSGGYASSSFGSNASPVALAIDGATNVWVTTDTTVVQLSNTGTLNGTFLNASTTPSGCSFAAFNGAGGIAFDRNGNAWITGPPVFELSSTGANMSGCGYATSLSYPIGIAVDSTNNIWVADYYGNSIVKLDYSSGAVLSTITDTSINEPNFLAIDSSNNVWAANQANSYVSKVSGTTGTVTSFTGGGLLDDLGIAMDGSSNSWVTPNGPSYFGAVGLTNSGTPFTGSNGLATGVSQAHTGATYMHYASAVDGSGNVWVTNTEWTGSGTSITPYDSISEILGAATPVVTPLAVATSNATIATTP